VIVTPYLRHSFFITFFFLLLPPPPRSTLFPYTTLFRSRAEHKRARWNFHSHGDQRVCADNGTRANYHIVKNNGAHANQHFVIDRSEEHTSELQSRFDLVCRLLLEKKKKNNTKTNEIEKS